MTAEAESASDPNETQGEPRQEAVQLKIWELAWPTILSNLLFSVIGIISIKIVGALGSEAVAAVTTGHRIFFAVQAVLMAVSTGTTAMVARAWGAKNQLEAARVTSASLWAGNLVALILTAPCFFFAEPIAGIFGLNQSTTLMAADFIRYLSIFNVAFSINMILGASLRAAGDTRTPLWIGAFMNVVNVLLVYALVYGEWGMPRMETNGAAVASGLSFTAAALVLLALWYGKRLVVGVGGRGSFTRQRLIQLYQIGYPAAIEQFVFQIGFVGFLWLVAQYGTAPYAAYGIGVQILSVSFVVGFGFSIAGATLVGQYIGAGDPEGAKRKGWRATRLAIASMVLLSAVILPFAHELAAALINEPDVIRYTVIFIYILGAAQPLMGIEFSLSGCLRGAGDTRYPLLTTMVGLVGVRVGLAALFMSLSLSVTWIFAALLGDYLIKALMLVHRFRSGRWKNKMRRYDFAS
ncbi:MAG: MATE family efflux transporter [Pseudomonadales bacterium]